MQIGDGDRGVVECGADMGDAFRLDDALALLCGSHGLLGHLLLARNGAARPLLGARVGVRALPAHRQPAAMARATIRANVHQALDVHRYFSAQGTFDAIVALDFLANFVDIGVGQITNAERQEIPAPSRILSAVWRPIPKMYVKPISTFFSRGRSTPAMRAMVYMLR